MGMQTAAGRRISTRTLTTAAIMTAVTVVCSQISIPLPFTPVPFSLALLAVFLTGALLPPSAAFLSQLVYLLLGICGLPVFAKFGSGIGTFAGPTGGYLFCYPLMALLTALCLRWFRRGGFLRYLPGMFAALALCHLAGSAWLAHYQGISFGAGLAAGTLPFLPFDAAKVLIAAGLGDSISRALGRVTAASRPTV